MPPWLIHFCARHLDLRTLITHRTRCRLTVNEILSAAGKSVPGCRHSNPPPLSLSSPRVSIPITSSRQVASRRSGRGRSSSHYLIVLRPSERLLCFGSLRNRLVLFIQPLCLIGLGLQRTQLTVQSFIGKTYLVKYRLIEATIEVSNYID